MQELINLPNLYSKTKLIKLIKFFSSFSYHFFPSLCFLLSQNAEVSVFEVNIRFIGGLLAAYYLSGQEVSAHLSECRIVNEVFWQQRDETRLFILWSMEVNP